MKNKPNNCDSCNKKRQLEKIETEGGIIRICVECDIKLKNA